MRMVAALMVSILTCVGGFVFSQEPPPSQPVPPSSTEPVSIQEMDYQIQICKQYMENYKNQAYLFDQKAQSLMSHDFMGYREAEQMSQQCKSIADDLAKHLQELQKKREQMLEKGGKQQTPPQK
jgi:hypothetical protein